MNEVPHRAACRHPSLKRNRKSHLVLAVQDLRGNDWTERGAEYVFQGAIGEFDVRRHRCCEFHERMVEERHPRFEAVGHADAVLDMKERWQKRFEVEMGHAVEVRLFSDVIALEDRPERFIW